MEDIEIKQTRGPTLRFNGEKIASDEGGRLSLEIWQTKGGALVALTEGEMHNRSDQSDVRAIVVEPDGAEPVFELGTSEAETDGSQVIVRPSNAMKFAVMDFFAWDNRARSMVRKQLKWSLVKEVE